MYLTRKKYVGAEWSHRNVTGEAHILIGDKELPIKFERLSYIEESVCYWRKANQIHKWFVDNVQNGVDDWRSYDVELEDLKKLLSLCKEVKEKAILKEDKVSVGETLKDGEWEPILEDGKIIENAEEIAELLPTSSGCFFGSTSYDEFYMNDIEHTIKDLEEIIKDEEELRKLGFYSEFYYQASW